MLWFFNLKIPYCFILTEECLKKTTSVLACSLSLAWLNIMNSRYMSSHYMFIGCHKGLAMWRAGLATKACSYSKPLNSWDSKLRTNDVMACI